MQSPRSWRNRSPGDLSIELPEVFADEVEPAIERSCAAFADWSRKSVDERASLLKNAQRLIEAKKEALAHGIALETGKPIKEATGEVAAVVAKFDLTIADAQQWLKDETPDNAHPAIVRRRARGPAVVVGPFNFPLHLPNGQILAHLIAGNTVIFKPSPVAANVCATYGALLAGALPAGVFQVVQGGADEGRALCADARVRSVAFTGSVPVGHAMAKDLAGDFSKDVALELGGKNAAIVCADADLDAAAGAIATAMCLTAGQRCNATSRVIVDQRVSESLIGKIVQALETFVPGDPLNEATTLGPLVSAAAVDRYRTTIDSRPTDGRWIVEGSVPGEVDGKKGHYVTPAILHFSDPAAAMRAKIFVDEVFAPVLTIVNATDESEMLRLHDLAPFGLTASIFTRSRATFDRLASQLHVGNVYANLPTTMSPSTLPFGGLRDSGNGRPGGKGFVRFTTDEQVVQIGPGSLE